MAIIGQELVIVFLKDRVSLTQGKSISIQQIESLPEYIDYFKESHWKIRVIGYKEEERRLFGEILSYELGAIDFSLNQLAIAKELNDVEVLAFRSMSFDGINKTTVWKRDKNVFVKQQTAPINLNTERIITETFSISIKDIEFKNGGVSLNRHFKDCNKTVEIYIENPDIVEEYDAIKNYFVNILNAKDIKVTATIELVNNQLVSVKARSTEIDKINKALIEEIRLGCVKLITSGKTTDDNANILYTIDEYFDAFAEEDLKANVFYANEQELINDLLKISNTKHYKHLRYLSNKHCHGVLKLRFIHKPFSFVFLIESENKYHFIWETLDTKEATYIWHIDKKTEQIENELKTIEEIIGAIKLQGKTTYINSRGDNFNRIYHDYRETVDGFSIWKDELESIIAKY